MLVVHGFFHYKITGIVEKQNNKNKKDKSIKAYPFLLKLFKFIQRIGLNNLAIAHLVLGLKQII